LKHIIQGKERALELAYEASLRRVAEAKTRAREAHKRLVDYRRMLRSKGIPLLADPLVEE
jgi:hypothetical protein